MLSFRSFSLRLHHDTGVFHPDVQIETSHDTLHYDTSHAYIGHLYGKFNGSGYLQSGSANRRRTLAYLQSRDEPIKALGSSHMTK